MVYNAAQLTETGLQFTAASKEDHFNPVYEIRSNGSLAEYSCPLGWVFQDSHNTTHRALCSDWNWTADFNISKPCVRK